jgi:hypothetical protein
VAAILAGAAILYVKRHLHEWAVIVLYEAKHLLKIINRAAREKIADIADVWRQRRDNWQNTRNWKHYAKRPEEHIARKVGRLRERAKSRQRRADALADQINRNPNSEGAMRLRSTMTVRLNQRDAFNQKADKLAQMQVNIRTARILLTEEQHRQDDENARCLSETQQRESIARARRELLGLVQLLDSSSDDTASAALTQLNKLGRSIEWDALIPATLPELIRVRSIKILRQMVGTNSVGEARSAKRQADRMLRDQNMTWDRMVA